MACVFELVGRDLTYPKAFKQAHDISLSQAVSDVYALMERTQPNPAERFMGTFFDATLL